jgi:hypothetical protein
MQIIHAVDKLLLFLAYFLLYMFAIEWQKGCERQVAIQMTGVGLISAYGRRQFDLHARVIKALAVFEFEFY